MTTPGHELPGELITFRGETLRVVSDDLVEIPHSTKPGVRIGYRVTILEPERLEKSRRGVR